MPCDLLYMVCAMWFSVSVETAQLISKWYSPKVVKCHKSGLILTHGIFMYSKF